MFAALIDPRSLQGMMMLGGGLMVLGLIVWLISKGIFENTLVVAAVLTAASLAVHGAGCLVALKTRYKIAGQALTFLGCILLPLNLWFYHAHGLMTLEGNLWLGGVVCCVIYAATVLLLKDPLFMIAVEAGLTLTALLLLANQGTISDAGYLSLVLMGLAIVSIHAERAFAPEAPVFDRKRFGLPVFWSGHVQLAAALLTLLVSQLLAVFFAPDRQLSLSYHWHWGGNWLTQNYWLAGGLWLAGAYAYFYSDLIVRRIGVYIYLAAGCLIAAELTLIGDRLPAEVLIATPAITALLLTLISLRPVQANERFAQNLQPLALLLSGLSVVLGLVQHVRATSDGFAQMGWQTNTSWAFAGTMLLVTICTRAAALVFQKQSSRLAADYLFLSAASFLVVIAALLRPLGITQWSQQAPVLMLAPIGYMIAARLWRGQQPERPLAIAAHVGAGLILFHLLGSTLQEVDLFLVLVQGSLENLWMALTFAEAALFYSVAAATRRHGANVYAATACAAAMIWQLAGYANLPTEAYPALYALLGLIVLAASRAIGIEQSRATAASGEQFPVPLGVGTAAFHSATTLLSLAFLSGVLQGLARVATQRADWQLLLALAVTTVAGLTAGLLSPTKEWRRIYVVWSIGLASVALLTLNGLIDLSAWQKGEIFCVVIGIALLAAGYIGRFLESHRAESDGVTLALFVGSLLAPSALLIGTLYYRFVEHRESLPDEVGLVLVTVLMLVTGYSWQLKAPTLMGGISLATYLMVLIGMLAVLPNVAMGVYLAVGGGLLFAIGIGLSVYRDKLLALPEKIKSRAGLFRVLNWR